MIVDKFNNKHTKIAVNATMQQCNNAAIQFQRL